MKDKKRSALQLLELVLLICALVFAGIFVYRTVRDHRQLDYETQMRDEIHRNSVHGQASDAATAIETTATATVSPPISVKDTQTDFNLGAEDD